MLVVLSSATGAERLKKLLAREKIPSEIIQTPKSYSKGGCSYSLSFNERHLNKVKELVSSLHLGTKGFYSESK